MSAAINDRIDALTALLHRLQGVTAFAARLHDDDEGRPWIDDLDAEQRAGVLCLTHELAVEADAALNILANALAEASYAKEDRP